MKGLLVKDFRIILLQKYFFIVLAFLAVMFEFGTNDGFAVSYMTFMGAVFVLITISYDEYDNGMAFLMTLPVSRRTYTKEKYVFGILLGLAMWSVGVVVAVACRIVSAGAGDIDEIIRPAFIFIPLFMIIIAVIIPLQLKFGSEKGRIVLFLVVGGIVVICFGLKKLVEIIGIDMSKVALTLSKFSFQAFIGILFMAAVVALLISYAISRIIMEKKEF